MEKVKITIFIPVYNMAATVERAILSVLNQDYKNKELIVLDGGSTDGTVKVIEKYLDRIAYFASGPDGGSSKAMAANMIHVAGQIVGMIGADDYYLPGALTAAAKAYRESSTDVIYGDVEVRQPDGSSPRYSYADADLEKMYGCCAIFSIAAFVKKELLAEHYRHYFQNHEGKLSITTDHYLWLRLYHAGRRFAYIESELPIASFSTTGVTSREIYRARREAKILLGLVVGPEDQKNEKYYQVLERCSAESCVPFYLKAMEAGLLGRLSEEKLRESKDYVLFGAGDMGQQCVKLLRGLGFRIRYFVDNYPERIGGLYMGLPVDPPDVLHKERDAVLLISTVKYAEEIFQQVQAMNLNTSLRVVSYDDFCFEVYKMLGRDVLETAWEKGVIQ